MSIESSEVGQQKQFKRAGGAKLLGCKIAGFELVLFTKRVERSLAQGATIHTIKWWIDTICVFRACLLGEKELSLHTKLEAKRKKKKMR